MRETQRSAMVGGRAAPPHAQEPMSTPTTIPPANLRAGGRLSTAARVGGAFGVILSLFAIALVVVLYAFARMEHADHEVAHLDHAKHAGHYVAALVREQYIHQAHTIIAWSDEHLSHYREVAEQARASALEVAKAARSPEERRLADESLRLIAQNDAEFEQLLVPALRRNDHARVAELHARMEATVGDVVRLNHELNHSFEAQSKAARATADALRRRARLSILVCFGLATLVAAGLATAITRSIGARVTALREGAGRVGKGDWGTRIELFGTDEFAELATAFNDMAADLERHEAELVRSQKLASIGQLSAGLAHEINNPLGVILGYVRLMKRSPSASDDEALRVIEEEVLQCQGIVKGLLDLARPQKLSLEPVDLDALLRDCAERLCVTEGAAKLRMVFPRGPAPVLARGDEAKLRQVVVNLLTNAVDATPEGGEITLLAAYEGRRAVATISDSGPGIPEALRGKLFEPFFTTKPRGTGLGLAIAHAIVDAHGGELRFDPAPAVGARVTLACPRAEEASS